MSKTSFAMAVIALLLATEHGNSQPVADQVLALAEDAGHWIIASGMETEFGRAWPDDALEAQIVGYDLGSGVAGKVVYFVALYRATGDSVYLSAARAGGDYLARVVEDAGSFEQPARRASLYSGVAGIGVALELLRSVDADPRHDAALDDVVALLDAWRVTSTEGDRWDETFNDLLYGDAGTALFLAWLAERSGDRALRDRSHRAARFLASLAVDAEVGHHWLFRRDRDFNLPNFSHGTAGVAYSLATIGSLTGDAALIDAASDGFDYIRSIAESADGALRIPYGWPLENWQGLYEFGWAHGLAGSALFFARLRQVGAGGAAGEFERLAVATLANIGLPGSPSPPFAEPSTPLDLRFGRAGVLSVLAAPRYADDPAVTATRDRLWMHLRDSAQRSDNGAWWEVDAPAFMGGGRAAYTGVLHGAAGIGLSLLKLHAALSNVQPYVALPDDPDTW